MPGTDLNLDLPTPNDPFVTALAKIVAAFTAIEADLEPRIGAGSLDIDTELSMNGAALTNVGGVRLQNGESTVVGTIYMDEELWAVTTAGAVQITNQGVLNITALGVIGGDYGGSNPAEVTFVDAAAEYRFKETATDWADISCRDIILNGAAGTFRLGADSGLSGDQEIRFKSVPVTGHGMFAFNSADNSLVDAAGVSPVVGGMTFTANVDIGNFKLLHGDRTITGPICSSDAVVASGTVAFNGSNPGAVVAGVSRFPIRQTFDSQSRIKTITVYFESTSYANITIGLSTNEVPGVPGFFNVQLTPLTSTATSITLTLVTPHVVVAGRPLWIRIDSTLSGTPPKPTAWDLTYDVAA